MRKGEETRERILDIAQNAVLAKGFGATSIEEIIAEAHITKSGFFYHFSDKGALARALLARYVAMEDEILDSVFDRARALTDDPLHAMLIGLKLFAELLDDIETAHPGCLVASICYQERLFDREILDLNRASVLSWRHRFRQMFGEILDRYTPREPVDVDVLADMFTCVVEGGLVLSKTLQDKHVAAQQLLLMRSYVKLLFEPQTH